MTPPSRIPGPDLRIVNASADRGAGPAAGLKVGALVSVEVRERLGPELYRVAAGGRLFVASSSLSLDPGSLLRARVELAGGALSLRLEPRDILRPGDLPAGLPADAPARAAAAALLREGLAPEAKSLARVRRAALRDGEGADSVDLAARMEAKGIPAEEEALGELLALSEGRGGEARERGGEGRESGRHSEDAASEAAAVGEPVDLDRDLSVDLSEEEFPKRLAALLRAMAMRRGEGSDSLALFNQAPGPEGHWLIVPFRFDADSVAFKGGLRIQLPYAKGGQGRVEAVFTASRGSLAEEWSLFAVFGGGRKPSLRVEAPAGSAAGERARSGVDALARGLASLACSVRVVARGAGAPPAAREGGGLDLDA